VSDLVDAGEEVIDGVKADVALSEFSTGDDLGAEFVVVAEEEMLPDADFAAWTDQALPLVRILSQLMREENLDAPAKELVRSGILRAQRLRVEASTASVETRGKHASVVEDDEIGGVKKIGEFAEVEVAKGPARSAKTKQAGSRAIGKGLLRDQFLRKFELKIGDEHEERL